MEIRIATGTDPGRVTTKTVNWQQLVDRLSQHEVSPTKGGRYFVGGAFSAPERIEANLECRSLLTLDIDRCSLSLEAIEFELSMGIEGAYVAYSTYGHTTACPRIRLVLPLSREVLPAEYPSISRRFASLLPELTFDPCSYIPNQFMFFPQCPDPALAWHQAQGGDPWPVPDDIEVDPVGDDLDTAVADQTLDITDDTVDVHLSAYDPEYLEYDDWLKVGMALHHQYRGTGEGYERWLAWSGRSSRHDPQRMPARWTSMGRHRSKVTFASVMFANKLNGDSIGGVAFDDLAADASKVTSIAEYDAFKERLAGLQLSVLPADKRTLLAAEIHAAWGKDAGLPKSDIRRALMPVRGAKPAGGKMPYWLAPWVYVEKTGQFYHTTLHYGISREAFDVKFGGEVECLLASKPASRVASQDHDIPTVVDLIFWPGAGVYVEYQGKRMLNTYREQGVVPADALDADGQGVVDSFMAHVRFLIADEGEQRLLVDFMAWVIQHPGEKINWALLMQGAQGTGKSYFGAVMMEILGGMARNLEPGALGGRFTAWAFGAMLVVVEEVRVAGESRYQILDRLKPFIANSTIQIEEKGRDQRTVPNFASYLMFTNHKDALPVGDGDRRYAPIFARIQSEEELFRELGGREAAGIYFTRLFDGALRRPDALSRYLRDWHISPTFSAKGRAPETLARSEMVGLAITPAREMVEALISQHECEVINDDIVDVTWLGKLCEGVGGKMPQGYVIASVLLEMGYRKISNRRIRLNANGLHYLWLKNGQDDEVVKNRVRTFHRDDDNDEI